MKQTKTYLPIAAVTAAVVVMLSACGGGGGNSGGTGDGAAAAAASFQGVWELKCGGTPVGMINGVYPETGADIVEMATSDSYITITGSNEQLQTTNTYYVYDIKDTNCLGKPILKLEIGGDPINGKTQGSPEQGFININRGPTINDRLGTILITSDTNDAFGENGLNATEFKVQKSALFDTTDGNYPESLLNIPPGVAPFYKWGPFLFGAAGPELPKSYSIFVIKRVEERNRNTNLVINPGVYYDFLSIAGASNPGNLTETEVRAQAKKNLLDTYYPGTDYKRIAQIPDYEQLRNSR
jgi:hypothetical protein